MKNKYTASITILILIATTSVDSSEIVSRSICKNQSLTRIVSHRVFGDSGVPCDVFYEKPNEGGVNSSEWSAKNQSDYCVEKYNFFIQNLRDLGWSCVTSADEIHHKEEQRKEALRKDVLRKEALRREALRREALSNVNPFFQINTLQPNTRIPIYNRYSNFIGFTGDYIQFEPGWNQFRVRSGERAGLSITIILKEDKTLEIVSIEPSDKIGRCPDRLIEVPPTIMDTWPTSPVSRTGRSTYGIEIGEPKFSPRPKTECRSIPSDLGGLKWSNVKLTINSNVSDASIYQVSKTNGGFERVEKVDGVLPGQRFSAIFRQYSNGAIDRDISFTLRKLEYSNCNLVVDLPLSSDTFRCDLIKLSDLNIE